ncbi:hypothetical protein [Dactylosporangium sp. NPDC048998]
MRVSIGICRTPGGDPHIALGSAGPTGPWTRQRDRRATRRAAGNT